MDALELVKEAVQAERKRFNEAVVLIGEIAGWNQEVISYDAEFIDGVCARADKILIELKKTS